jgi:cellulose synthase/poly-beta-1,6-N-acetylglucosamine synthase-like glycosyltransferase
MAERGCCGPTWGNARMLLTVAAWLIAVPVAAALAVFVVEAFAGLAASRPVAGWPDVSIVVVVPAHDEEAGIARSLAALKAALPDTAHVLVVADNCSDRTAELAHAAGVDVVERHDPERRGKGYALAFARDALTADPPQAVVILDADCTPVTGTIAALGAAAVARDGPVQAVNLLRADLNASPMVQISSFAFLVKNLIRQRGAARVGRIAILGGTGMALPWSLFAHAPLASGDIVEDLSLGIWATRQGHVPRFLPSARVESAAAAQGDTLGQRSRWEHGFLHAARTQALALIGEGVGTRNWPMLWMGLHLCVPPLALLVLATTLALAATVVLALLGASWVPAAIVDVLATLMFVAIVLAWLRHGRATLSLGALLRVPLYVLWKLPVYLRLFGGSGAKTWQRTPRAVESDRPPE